MASPVIDISVDCFAASVIDAGEAFAIWPERRPEVARMETDRAKLFDLYMEGWLRAARAWPALRAYLES